MPVKLRLRRQGRSKSPHYAIVAADSRSPRDGRFIEKIGFYNPITSPAKVYFDYDLAIKWLQNGAQPTNTVRHLLRHAGITVKFALIKQGKNEEDTEKIFTRWWIEKQGKAKKVVEMVTISGKTINYVPGYGEPENELETVDTSEDPSTQAVESTPERIDANQDAVEDIPTSEDKAENQVEAAEASSQIKDSAEETSKEENIIDSNTPEETSEAISSEETPKSVSSEESPEVTASEETPKPVSSEKSPEATASEETPKSVSSEESPEVGSSNDSVTEEKKD